MSSLESTDQQLISRALAGDSLAFESLLERYRSRVLRLALRFTRDDQEAQEVLQEVFLSVFRKLDQFEGKSSFSTWIYRVAVNASLMRIRDRGPAEVVSLDELSEDLPSDDASGALSPDDRIMTEESLAQIEKAMADLSYDYLSVFILRDIEGFSNEETAEILSLSVAAVKSRLHRAREILRKTLRDLYRHTVEV